MKSGGGVILYLSKKHFYKIKMGFGKRSNNGEKLLACKYLLRFAKEKGCNKIQVFRDSLLVINWINGAQLCRNIFLAPILDEVLRKKSTFDNVLCAHVFRERNTQADCLSS